MEHRVALQQILQPYYALLIVNVILKNEFGIPLPLIRRFQKNCFYDKPENPNSFLNKGFYYM